MASASASGRRGGIISAFLLMAFYTRRGHASDRGMGWQRRRWTRAVRGECSETSDGATRGWGTEAASCDAKGGMGRAGVYGGHESPCKLLRLRRSRLRLDERGSLAIRESEGMERALRAGQVEPGASTQGRSTFNLRWFGSELYRMALGSRAVVQLSSRAETGRRRERCNG